MLDGAQRIIRECRPALYLENNPGPKQQPLIDYVHSLDYLAWWHLAPLFNPHNFAGNPNCDADILDVVSSNMLCLPREGDNHITGLEAIPCKSP